MAKADAEVYRPADACRIAEVAPYVLRYWETEFAALSEGKDKGGAKLYTARDVRIISRIRELLYDEGFTVAGAKKRLDAEIAEGRFDDGLAPAPPLVEQRKTGSAAASAKAGVPASKAAASASLLKGASSSKEAIPTKAPATSAPSSDFDRKRVLRELKEIVKLLDRR